MKTTFTNILLISLFSALAFNVQAQNSVTQDENTDYILDGKNLIKLNVLGLPLKNFSLQYERAITNKISVLAGINVMPKSGIPLLSLMESLIDDEETYNDLKSLRLSNFSFTPEVRFYLNKKDSFKGFYLAPFARIGNYKVSIPIDFDVMDQTETIPLNGSINTISGGLMIGTQFKLAKSVYLDWQIIGPHYGKATGDIIGKKSLTPEEVDAVKESLGEIDLPLIEYTFHVDGNGASWKVNGPWVGIKSNLSIAYRF